MAQFLDKLLCDPHVKTLLSNEHFSVDGTLVKAWASHSSLKRKDGQDEPPLPSNGVGFADGYGERDAATRMAAALPGKKQKTMGAEKGYDTKGFVAKWRYLGFTPDVSQNTRRKGGPAIDRRTTRPEGNGGHDLAPRLALCLARNSSLEQLAAGALPGLI